MKESRLFPLAILLTLLVLVAHTWLTRLPEVKPASSPETEFSASRAVKLLDHLLQENQAHVIGSQANALVRSRIVTWLEENGINYEIQSAWGCASERNTCGWVKNIVARIPGTEQQRPSVALMAHYDSVPMSPGAGDDGAGVVAVLETARALKAHGPLPNPVLLIIPDGEEAGLLGAEAFFKFHPLAKEIGVILNVEGSGTTGASMVLRTAKENATIMAHYLRGASYPNGESLANEVLKRMSNDTDFSVSMRAGVPGIDFAFSAERNHYHTPNDNVANLNPRTVQHHGENLLPTVLRLASEDLTQLDPDHVVFSGMTGVWIQWSSSMTKWLLVLAAVLLVAASVRLPGTYWQLTTAATLVPLAIVLLSSLLAFLAFYALGAFNGTTVSWPAHLWPFRMVLFSSMLTSGLIISGVANRRMSVFVALLGSWIFWWLLVLLLVLTVPDAANVVLIPLLPAAVLLFVVARIPLGDKLKNVLCLATLVPAITMLPGAIILEQTQGYQLIVSSFIFIALYSLIAGGFARGPLVKRTVLLGIALVVVGMVSATVLPLYSAWRPQHVNIDYIENADEQTAYWRLRSNGPAPESILAEADFSLSEIALYPWVNSKQRDLASAPDAQLATPDLVVLSADPRGDGRRVRLRLHSNRAARFLQLVLLADSSPLSYTVGGNELKPVPSGDDSDRGVFRFVFLGVQSQDVDVTIDFEDNKPVSAYLLDSTTELPVAAKPMLVARSPLASPVHVGDMGMVFKEYVF
ncbi:MAG: M20/M25/M40 family metallo-hydrolase [Gammaproteobacteria bacterium]|nr:M20/M25/M40 family metallo-hydrolase [Gammaproteobacteria bacterium]